MSKERADAMLKAWWGGRSNINQRDTERFQSQYDMAVEDNPWALVPNLNAFDGDRRAQTKWLDRVRKPT